RENILVPEVLNALRDRDEEVRTSAAIAAGKFRMAGAIDILRKMHQKDKIKQVREAAMMGLALMRKKEVRPYLRQVAQDDKEDRRIRGFAIFGLGFLRDREFLRPLLENKKGHRMKGSKPDRRELRGCVSLMIGFCRDDQAIQPLVRAAMDKYEMKEVRGYAPCSLSRLNASTATPELLRLIRDGQAEKVARYGSAIAMGGLVKRSDDAAIDFLGKKVTRDRDIGVRTLLAISLGRIGGDRAASYLISGLKRSSDQRERGFYFLGAGLSKADGVGELLTKQFKNLKNNKDRAACALGLGLANYRKAAPMILEEVERGNPAFAGHGMVALGLLDHKKAIPVVRKMIFDKKDPETIREGALALALLRGPAAVPDLVKLLEQSRATYTRGAVAFALGFVGDANAVPPLLKILRNKNKQGELRAIALAALGRIGDPLDIPLLSYLARNVNPYVVIDAVGEALTIL
ncbi:MAG: HEAT repeat domain-containing protein, partial [Planctomycetota bacterium]